ncbi:MAG: aminotransferase class V-fold PLP-dependent enzyme [Promethearchaeia archaeon]
MKINWENIREEEFPALKSSVLLMAAGGSPMCKSAYNSVHQYLKGMHEQGDLFWEKYLSEIKKTKEYLSDYLNCSDDEIALFSNTSSGFNIIARILKKGNVLYPKDEFPTSIHIFKASNYKCIKIPSKSDNIYSIESIRNFSNRNIDYLIHSHIQYLTGFRQNLKELGKICSENNWVNIINATQSFGAFPIDVKNYNICMLSASSLKWACAGYGAGILYINNNFFKEKNPPFTSWLSVENFFEMDNDNMNIIRKTCSMDFLGGSPNFMSALALKGSLELIKKIGSGDIKKGVMNISNRILSLSNYFIDELLKLNFKIITPINPEYRSGIITIESKKATTIYYNLIKNNIISSLRNYQKSPEKTLIRFALNYYNNFDDIDKTLEVLKNCKQ